jgi:DNA repair protein RecN (Recombination protein N)
MLYRLSGETDTNIIAGLHQVKQHGETLAQSYPELKGFNEMMQSAVINCEEALNEFDHFQSQLDVNPERLQQVEHRLERIFDIARKHHVKAQQLHLHHQELTCKLKTLQNASKEAVKLEALRQQAFKDYEKLCAKLRQKRHKEASVLASQITKTIKALGMPNGLVEIQIEAIQQPYAHGMDKIEYYVRPNQGFEPQPLSKIASGGELSRISLAIQVLTAEKKSYPTLIFDEVDTGIGGVTAAAVGQLLQRLGNHTQVFCVTHQAQVASNALHHFMVEKTTKNKQTYSDICKLNDKDRIDELARMLSGLKVTKQTKAHAKELLSQAQDNKQCA